MHEKRYRENKKQKKYLNKFFVIIKHKKISFLFLFLLISAIVVVVGIFRSFEKYESLITHALVPEQFPSAPIAIVFGAGMKKDGVTMTEMQRDRVIRAAELYNAGKVPKLLITGDDGSNNVDEVHAMKKLAIEMGVEPLDILIDPAGFNTYLSCRNARKEFALDQAIVVSQTFHLKRILYYCLNQGIQVQGVEADISKSYGFWGSIWVAGIRESLARTKAILSSGDGVLAEYVVR